MSILFATFAAVLIATPSPRADTVRIGLFTLFKPHELIVRIVSGEGGALDANRIAGSRRLARGERVRFRLAGGQIEMIVSDSFGRVLETSTTSEARIATPASSTIELTLPGKMRRVVRGELTVHAPTALQPGVLKIVLITARESAVASVVAAETEARVPEALKALAVVVRTFMLSHPNRHPGEGFDFCDTTHCQFYRGEADLAVEADSPAVAAAVAATAGEQLLYEGNPVETYFTSSCGGITATPRMVWGGDSNYPYQPVVCQWCRGSSHYTWTRMASAKLVFNALSASLGFALSRNASISVERDEATGFVRGVVLGNTGRDRGPDMAAAVTMSADEFRRAIGRRLGWNTVLSPTFTLTRQGERFVFQGKGFGSQVGLCLAGAAAQARAGRSYDQILQFYFPQAKIGKT